MLMGFIKRSSVIVILLWGMLFSSGAFAQGNDQMPTVSTGPAKLYYPYILEAGGELIYPISDYAFKDNFHGVLSFHGSLSRRIAGGFYVGLEGNYNQVSVGAGVPFPVATGTTHIFYYGGGIKLGFYSAQNGDWLFNFAVVAGESFVSYTNAQYPTPTPGTGNEPFISPRICESYKVNDNLFIGLEVTYTMYTYSFDPMYLGIQTSYTPKQLSGTTGLIGWGFGLHYLVGKAKK
jgi:hypothetical protein